MGGREAEECLLGNALETAQKQEHITEQPYGSRYPTCWAPHGPSCLSGGGGNQSSAEGFISPIATSTSRKFNFSVPHL